MTRTGSSLERRLLRSHLAVAGIGAVMLLIALVATTWLRSNSLRLASVRGPTVRATALAQSGLHQSAEALYGWIVTHDPTFRQVRARAWREQILPATEKLERLRAASGDPQSNEHFDRLGPVLASLHDWQVWVEEVADSDGGVPPSRLLERHGRELHVETMRLARSLAELTGREDPRSGRRLATATAELEGAVELSFAHLEDVVRRGDTLTVAAVERDLARSASAMRAFSSLPVSLDAEAVELSRRLARVFASYEQIARRVVGARQQSGWNLAEELILNEAIPTTQVATQLLTTLAVTEEELMLADAARVEWFSNATVIVGVMLFLVLLLTAVLASRRHAARITRPIRELSWATGRLADGHYDGTLPVRGDDEIAKLSGAFNTMRESLRERSEALERSRGAIKGRNHQLRDEVEERRRAEQALARRTQELERANDKLERRNAELDEFTHVASHDLQEPLRKILSFSKLLRMDMGGTELPERAEQDLEFITRAAARMQSLVQDLLTLSRTGRSAMSLGEVPLDRCLDAAIEHLEVQIAETGADISREGLPSAVVDETLMTQLFQNLIGNAIKFHEKGERPVVRITHETRDGELIIGVSDQGIGIKPEYAEQIFSPFKRLHGRDAYEGTGIGLAICRKAVIRHGGKIWVESTEGQGAHFRFTLGSRTRTDRCREAA